MYVKDDFRNVGEKLKAIGLGLQDHHDSFRCFVRPTYVGDGKVPAGGTRLSWRVHILPYIQPYTKMNELYESFHLDEAWDSPHNRKLLDKMPDIYRLHSSEKGYTRFQIFTGPGGLVQPEKALSMQYFLDGTSNVLLVVTVGPDKAVPWTKPDTLAVDKADPWAPFGTLPDGILHCNLADHAYYRLVAKDIPKDSLLQMIDMRDGVPVNYERYLYRRR